jgi:hypothetical protein
MRSGGRNSQDLRITTCYLPWREIRIGRSSGHFVAHIIGMPSAQGKGTTAKEAIAELVLKCPTEFGIRFEDDPSKWESKR